MIQVGGKQNTFSIDRVIDREYRYVDENIRKQRACKIVSLPLFLLFVYSLLGIIPLLFTAFCCQSLHVEDKTTSYFTFGISWAMFSICFGLILKYTSSQSPTVKFSDRLFHMMYRVFQIIDKYNIPGKEREMSRDEKIRCARLIRKFIGELGLEVSKGERVPSFTETEHYKNFQIILDGLTEKIQTRIDSEKDFDEISKIIKEICVCLIGRGTLSSVSQNIDKLTIYPPSKEEMSRTALQKLLEYIRSESPFVAYGAIVLPLTCIIIPIYIIISALFAVDLTILILIATACYTIPALLLAARRK